MRLTLIVCTLLVFSGCASWLKEAPQKSQLEIREFQTRTYQTKDEKLVLKAMLHALQDEDFIIKNAESELGFISAEKEKSVASGAASFFAGLSDQQARYKSVQLIEATVNVQLHGNETRVRATFREKIIDNFGDTMKVRQITDESFYQSFFSKADKSIFIQKEKI